MASSPQAVRRWFVSVVFVGIALTNYHRALRSQTILLSAARRGEAPTSSPYLNVVGESDRGYEVVTTNYGWTTANWAQFSQRKVSAEFFDAVRSHPRYNASAWADLEQSPDPSRQIIAFMDLDTCIEGNYPEYGQPNFSDNSNITVEGEKFFTILDKSCAYIKRASESPALTANKDSRLVLLDCGTGPFYNIKDACVTKEKGDGGWSVLNNNQVIIAYYGITKTDARPIDIGLPPPAIKPMVLRPYERLWIETCRKRDILFSFQGKGGDGRDALASLHNGNEVYVKIKDKSTYWGRVHVEKWVMPDGRVGGTGASAYEDILRESTFGGAPRGDCLWSYRYTEILSAGAIPVVYAKDWLAPFASKADPDRVINWTKCGGVPHLSTKDGSSLDEGATGSIDPNAQPLSIGELNWQKASTTQILRAIPNYTRCEMQKCSLAIWDEFASSRKGWLKGIISWVRAGDRKRTSHAQRYSL